MTPEGIKYTGSKQKILPYILKMAEGLDVHSVLDAFTGSTRVAQAFAQQGKCVTANDTAEWSEVFATCYLLANKPDAFYQPLIDELNALPGIDGWFSAHYGGEGPDGKRPFQLKNTRRLDAIRSHIDTLDLAWEDKCVLLTSLILALDDVDNTLGHYAAYLSGWSRRSYNDLTLRLPRRFPLTGHNRVLRQDVFDVVGDYHDLAYLDPPYGSNNRKMPASRVRYAAYYHIWKTVVLNDQPAVFGKANRRVDSRDGVATSVFEDFRQTPDGRYVAMEAIDRLIRGTNAHYIMLSYSSSGRATRDELRDILSSNGTLLQEQEIDHRRNVMSRLRWTNEWINSDDKYKEYLFLMEK